MKCLQYLFFVATILLSVMGMSCSADRDAKLPVSTPMEGARLLTLDSPTIANLQTLIDRQVKTENIPGIVLQISTPENTWVGAAGVADLETKTPLKKSDRFRIGSITKTFVAVVMLQLYESREISLEDTIADWLPAEISEQIPNGEKITIRQLLNHTSGLDDFGEDFFEDFFERPDNNWTAQKVIEYLYGLEPLAAPGKEFYYSNSNYILLELIVEEVTGNSLAQELRDRIYRPLGLNNTFMEVKENIPGGFVSGYDDWDEDGTRENMTELEPWGLGDGGMISTASDLATFLEGLFVKQQLLSPETLDEMLDFIEDDEGDQYGLGISSIETDWGEAIGHSGSTGGFLSTMFYLPDRDIKVIVLTNSADAGSPDEIAEEAVEIVLDEVE